MRPEDKDNIDREHKFASYRMMTNRLRPEMYPEPVSPFRWLFELCRRDNPGISTNERVLGGIPHIEGTRLSVGQVLGRLYVLGSILEVAKYYSELNLSEDQVREAVSYAQEFVELAGEPHQTYD